MTLRRATLIDMPRKMGNGQIPEDGLQDANG